MVYAAARLGLADRLADGPRTVEALATSTGTRPDLLRRLLRLLVSVGIFAEVEPGVFGPTAAGDLLRDRPGSLRLSALAYAELGTIAWRDLVGVLQTGETGYQRSTGMREWAYYARHPEAGALFNAWMSASSQTQADAIIGGYDFPARGTVVDVAGGQGTLLAAILQARPAVRGILFDAPNVVAGAAPLLAAAGVADRCRIVAGDFFDAVPEGGDLYTMKWILHDWDDERAVAILSSCRRAMDAHGTLLIVDRVIPAGPATTAPECFEAYRADVMMMAWTGGVERTVAEFRALLAAARFRLGRIIPTTTALSMIEAHPI
jgi:hypothetical protein